MKLGETHEQIKLIATLVIALLLLWLIIASFYFSGVPLQKMGA